MVLVFQMQTTLGDWQFLYFDLVLVTSLAILMGRGGPSEELQPRRPSASLLTLPILGSLLILMGFIILGQWAAVFLTKSQDWSVKERRVYYQSTTMWCSALYPKQDRLNSLN